MAAFSAAAKEMTDIISSKTHRQAGLAQYHSKLLAILSNDTYALSHQQQDKLDSWLIVETLLLLLYPTFLLAIGIPGNIMTLIILQKENVQENVLTIAMSGVAVVNLWCLGTGVIRFWSTGLFDNGDFIMSSYHMCLRYWTATAVGLSSSHWMIVLVICCRIHFTITPSNISMEYPASRTIGLVILVILVNAITQGSQTHIHVRPFPSDITAVDSDIVCVWKKASGRNAILHYILLSAAPLLALMVLNLLMCSQPSLYPLIIDLSSLEARREAALKMALVEDLHFILFALPFSVFPFVYSAVTPTNQLEYTELRISSLIIHLFLYTGSATQFYILYYFCKRFRRETVTSCHELFGCCGRWQSGLSRISFPSKSSTASNMAQTEGPTRVITADQIDTNVDKGQASIMDRNPRVTESFDSLSTCHRHPSVSV